MLKDRLFFISGKLIAAAILAAGSCVGRSVSEQHLRTLCRTLLI